jgi:hypothetical protein
MLVEVKVKEGKKVKAITWDVELLVTNGHAQTTMPRALLFQNINIHSIQ